MPTDPPADQAAARAADHAADQAADQAPAGVGAIPQPGVNPAAPAAGPAGGQGADEAAEPTMPTIATAGIAHRPTEYARALGERLRAVRREQRLSLQAVQERSDGRWKGVVVGSYERGDRAITVQRLAELADFYGVSAATLLPDLGAQSLVREDVGLRLDPRAVAALEDPAAAALQRYVTALAARRGSGDDPLTLRGEDVSALAAVYRTQPGAVADLLRTWQVTGR